MDKELKKIEQLILVGMEEVIRRNDIIYSLKNFLYRKLGLFNNWAKKQQEYYESKYPLIKT